MAVSSLKLRCLKKNDQDLCNAIAAHTAPVRFSLSGDWRFSFVAPSSEKDFDHRPQGHSYWVLSFFWGKGFFSLFVPDGVFCACLEEWLGDKSIQVPTLEAPLLLAVVNAAADQMIENISQLGFGPVRLHRVLPLEKSEALGDSGHWVSADICRLATKERYSIWFHTDAEGGSFLKHVLTIIPKTHSPVLWETVPILLRLQIGVTRLSSQQLRKVRKNDVILFDETYLQDHILFVLVSHRIGFRALWKDNQLIVQTALETVMGQKSDDNLDSFWDDEDTALVDTEGGVLFDDEEDEDDDEVTPRAQPESKKDVSAGSAKAPAPDLQNVPVHLSFDLGEKTIAFKDLGVIQPGYVFDLGRPLNHSVLIRANRHVIAEGELVDVDGHLGVTVSTLKK